MLAWSASGLFPFTLPKFGFKADFVELRYSVSDQGKVKRGTYGPRICFMPAVGKWSKEMEFSISSSDFQTFPSSVRGSPGESDACAMLGTAASTQVAKYDVLFTHTSSDTYTALPVIMIQVTDVKGQIIVPSEATCAQGGLSVPMFVYAMDLPFADVSVTIIEKSDTDGNSLSSELVLTGVTPVKFSTT